MREAVREGTGQKSQTLTSERAVINRAARVVAGEIDLRSTKRRAQLAPRLFRRVYDYTAPTNMKGYGIIDIARQTNRGTGQNEEFVLTTPEEFSRMKTIHPNIIAIDDFDFLRILKIAGNSFGYKHSAETKKLLSDLKKVKPHPLKGKPRPGVVGEINPIPYLYLVGEPNESFVLYLSIFSNNDLLSRLIISK